MNAVAALGVYISLMSGQLSAGHSAFLGIGAYSSALLTSEFGWPLAAAMAVAFCLCFVVGAFLSLVIIGMTELVMALVTVGLAQTMVVVAQNAEFVGGANGLSGIPFKTSLTLAVGVLLAAMLVTAFLERSPFGLAARAIRDNRITAESMGISISFVRALTFGAGAAVTAVAGVLYAHYVLFVDPELMGFPEGLALLVFVLLGGSYTFLGPVVGATLLTLLPELLRFTIAGRLVLYGALIALIILVRPKGLLRPDDLDRVALRLQRNSRPGASVS